MKIDWISNINSTICLNYSNTKYFKLFVATLDMGLPKKESTYNDHQNMKQCFPLFYESYPHTWMKVHFFSMSKTTKLIFAWFTSTREMWFYVIADEGFPKALKGWQNIQMNSFFTNSTKNLNWYFVHLYDLLHKQHKYTYQQWMSNEHKFIKLKY